MRKTCSILVLMLFPLTLILPQQRILHPDAVNYPVYMDKSPALISMKMIPPSQENEAWENNEIPNQIRPNLNKNIIKDENFRDPVVQDKFGPLQTTATIVNFDGMSNACSCYPPDPNGDVGPNHIIQSVNLQFQIWNKTGTSLYGPANLSTLWQDTGPGPWVGTNSGDPVVLYDQLADRWLISQFSIPSNAGPFYELIAISTTADPLGTYNRYIYTFTNLPDYPKIGVWRDGYYMSVNSFAWVSPNYNWAGTQACVMERDSMLVGRPARIVVFNTTTSDGDWSLLPSDADGKVLPPVGAPNYFMELWSSTTLGSRALHVDWSNTLNSTFSALTFVTVASYDDNMCSFSRNCIPQSGTSVKLDAISDRLLHRLQYRNFGSYQTIVANHTVDVGSDHAGVRWYELRNTGSGWTVNQQGTYAPDSTHRWMGSVAMDGDGNIGAGYSNSSSTMFPSIKYTGRMAGDTPGLFTLAEDSIKNGTGSQTGSASRWGDYSMMTVDPSDDATFWYINEYLATTSTLLWKTRIASFKISSPTLTLTAFIQGLYNGSTMVSDTVTVELHNAGSPYALVESQKGVLSSAGVGTFAFKTAVNGIPYYLVIKHRNGLETWSAAGNTFSASALSYNLTSGQSQAYGSNLVQKGTKWCIYSGDVNQDGFVDGSDLILVDNDNTNLVTGYVKTDVNGDNSVDGSDLIIVDNNNTALVGRVVPPGAPAITRAKQEFKFEDKSIIIDNNSRNGK